MPTYAYERLSGQDNDFLVWESPNLPMHVGGTETFAAGELHKAEGGIDFESIKHLTESLLYRIPRYRQKLAWIPRENHAVWVDDEHFNLDYHFRHTSLPRPGTDDQLKRLAARIMEQNLDRSRPLWETWVVEGLEGDRFALISKAHHCMIDGAAAVDLTQILLSKAPDRKIRKSPRFIPRPMPGRRELLRDGRLRRLSLPLVALRNWRAFKNDTDDLRGEIRTRLRALRELAQFKAVSAAETPLNGPVGPHRIVEWLEMPLADVKAVRKQFSCSVNDVVLATVTGAVRRFMQHRQVRPESLDFRASAPVNVHRENDREPTGNHVSSWVLQLPLGEEDPQRAIEAIRETTQGLKDSHQAVAVEMMNGLNEWLPINIQSASVGTMNMIVTNVPGPQFPLYMLGAELEEIRPLPPLIENLGLSVGVMSYNGNLGWGFNADYDRVPDLEDFCFGIRRSFERLADAAGVVLGGSRALELRSGSPPKKPTRAKSGATAVKRRNGEAGGVRGVAVPESAPQVAEV